jgi:hypothetical protein
LNFLELLGLSGGMPTRVSVPRSRLHDVFGALGISASEVATRFPIDADS